MRETRQCRVSGSFMGFHQVCGPVLAQHFCSERLGQEQRQVHLQVRERESACRLSSLIHRHQLQQRICLEYCYASRKGAVPLWSRRRTEAEMLRSSVLLFAVPSWDLHVGQCTVLAQGSGQPPCTVRAWEGWTDGHLKIMVITQLDTLITNWPQLPLQMLH